MPCTQRGVLRDSPAQPFGKARVGFLLLRASPPQAQTARRRDTSRGRRAATSLASRAAFKKRAGCEALLDRRDWFGN
eukprot:scaffold2943_cov239-Pinguiococcus_pyrenoidosus.AAC.1